MVDELSLNDLDKIVLRLGDRAYQIVKETLDKYANQFKDEVLRTTPTRTGALARSVQMKQVTKETGTTDIYGWSIRFVGKTSNGFDLNDVAYILNYYGYGRWDTSDIATIREIGFISQAVKTLRKINEEINERWMKEVA